MYNIATLNKISPVGLKEFTDKYSVSDDVSCCCGIVVRSADMHEMEFGKGLLAIARAGAGVNNIPLDRCAESGIAVFNTPGANANAVKELVIGAMILAARNIPAGIAWASGLTGDDVSKQVEKGKGQFAGTEISGKTLGVVGLGAIGAMVANAASALGMNVIGYDPYLSVNAALRLLPGVGIRRDIKELLGESDYITLHLPATDSTKGMFNEELLSCVKSGAVFLNFSRDKLMDEGALIKALDGRLGDSYDGGDASAPMGGDNVLPADDTPAPLDSDTPAPLGKISKYVTDFVTAGIHGRPDVIVLPHLGASTAEAEDNCAAMAARELMDYIENGNIVNSVNLPAVSLGPVAADETRVAVITKDEPDPVRLASAMFADNVIKAAAGGTRPSADGSALYGYALLSLAQPVTSVPKVDGVVRVRVLQDM